MRRVIWFLCVATAMVGLRSASATVDSRLTPFPRTPGLTACQRWAASQPSDEIARWGLLGTGERSRERALLRLTLTCLGDDWPEIVTFGSSIGSSVRYCYAHDGQHICDSTKKYCSQHPDDCRF